LLQKTKILYYKVLHRNRQKTTKKRKIINLRSNINFIFYVVSLHDFSKNDISIEILKESVCIVSKDSNEIVQKRKFFFFEIFMNFF